MEILQHQGDCSGAHLASPAFDVSDDGGCGGGASTDIRAGDLVRVRDGVWRVMEVRTFARARSPAPAPTSASARTRVLRLIGVDALNRWQPCTLLEPFDRPRRIDAAQAPRVVSRARWMRTCAALIAASPPPDSPATIADAQVTLMPYQIDPVLAVLRGRVSRLLLADAVGLGKTIQAALLLRELRARGCADRVLILVPSGLRDQWRQELSHRTGLRGDILDAAALAARTRELPPDINPWSLPGILIVSLDFIKQPSVLHGAGAIVWDILIVDEAHNLNEGTDRLAAADLLARHSRHLVLLTATPHHGSDDAFATLCRIGHIGGIDTQKNANEPDADPIAIFRRTRQTMGLGRTRKVHVLRVTPTKQERRLHTLLARYTGRVEREHGSMRSGSLMNGDVMSGGVTGDSVPPHAASLAMSVLLKRASSSASSLERSLRRRRALLDADASSAAEGTPPQPLLPFSDERDDDLADGEPSHVLGAPGLRSARVERAWLTLLIEASRNAARVESKPRALARLLRRCREPALVYTEYRDTLTHLARTLVGGSLSAGAGRVADDECIQPTRHRPPAAFGRTTSDPSAASSPYAMLHGGLGADARRTALARFASGDARILLTTDAAGEGLNLHHRCRLVINVELPWNPNRLEQRIGRVDRLGQTRTVHAIHLVAAGTHEEQMLTRLTGRVAQIAATLGDAPAVLRAAHEMVRAHTDTAAVSANTAAAVDAVDADADASAGADASPGAGATRGVVPRDGSRRDGSRSESAAAAEVTVQLQLLRAIRTRAWRIGRRHLGGPHASRNDPLLALDERAPLIAVTRRRRTCRGPERGAWRSRASPCPSGVPDLPGPGLLCLWRTRVHREDGHAWSRARPPSPVLTVAHIACEIPRFPDRMAIAAFVDSTLERCRARIQPLLDGELASARDRLDATERARIERLARRDDAIAAMLRARAAGGGSFQPLLFEDIAREKTTMTGACNENCSHERGGNVSCRSWTHEPTDAASGATELMSSSLVLVLIRR